MSHNPTAAEIMGERLRAALRREDHLQQRLTAANERADLLEGLLRELRTIIKDKPVAMGRIDAALKPASSLGSVKLRPDGTLSAQSGHISIGNLDYGSLDAAQRLALCRGEPVPAVTGSTCNQIREEAGQPINRPCKACGGVACIDR